MWIAYVKGSTNTGTPSLDVRNALRCSVQISGIYDQLTKEVTP